MFFHFPGCKCKHSISRELCTCELKLNGKGKVGGLSPCPVVLEATIIFFLKLLLGEGVRRGSPFHNLSLSKIHFDLLFLAFPIMSP